MLIACISLAPAGAVASGATAAPAWSLLPQPADLHPAASGVVRITEGARVAVRGEPRAQVSQIADQFTHLVGRTRGLSLRAATGADAGAAITFEVDPRTSITSDDGYRIEVTGHGVRVIARSPAGAYYGGVTLWQLLTPPGWSRGAAEIPAGVIEDHPRFAWRALLLDSGRHFQSVAEIEKLIDWMSLEKLNVLVWHLTEDQGWRLQIPKYPELTRTGACRKAVGLDVELTGAPDRPYCGFYSEADVREIVRHGAARFVTIVPEIDLPGHSQAAVAAYPSLGVTGERPAVWTDWGVSLWLLKPDEKTLQFVDDVLDEVMRLFPSRYVSIGGDEADKRQWNASAELQGRMRRLGLANMGQLQGWFTGRIADHLVRNGRTPLAWDDELAAGGKLPPPVVVMSWHGDDGQRVAREAAAQGHDVILAPEGSLYFDHYQSDLPDEGPGQPPMSTLRQAYDTALTPQGASAAEAARVIGVQGQLWTELVPDFAHVQHALYPRVAALAELGWSAAGSHDWGGFLQRLPAEVARYRALGIAYADSAFAPVFEVGEGGEGRLRVALSNQVSFGEIHYTLDGSVPGAASPRYLQPLEFPWQVPVTLGAATFAPDGFELTAPRSRVLDGSSLLSRGGSALTSCSGEPGMRVEGAQPAHGHRPVYTADIGNSCWLWQRAPLAGIRHVTLTVERITWRFGDEAAGATVRAKASTAGEFELHADSCSGPLLARLPLAAAVQAAGQGQLTAAFSAPPKQGATDVCIFATGDPREGQWALAQVALSN